MFVTKRQVKATVCIVVVLVVSLFLCAIFLLMQWLHMESRMNKTINRLWTRFSFHQVQQILQRLVLSVIRADQLQKR